MKQTIKCHLCQRECVIVSRIIAKLTLDSDPAKLKVFLPTADNVYKFQLVVGYELGKGNLPGDLVAVDSLYSRLRFINSSKSLS